MNDGIVVRDGEAEYVAADVDAVRQWVGDGRLSATATFRQEGDVWRPVSDLSAPPNQTSPRRATGRNVLLGCGVMIAVAGVLLVAAVVAVIHFRDASIDSALPLVRAAMVRGHAATRDERWSEAATAFKTVVDTVEGNFGSSEELRQYRSQALPLLAASQLRAGDRAGLAATLHLVTRYDIDPRDLAPDVQTFLRAQEEENRAAEERARSKYRTAARDLTTAIAASTRFVAFSVNRISDLNGDELTQSMKNLPKNIRGVRDETQKEFDRFAKVPVPVGLEKHAGCVADGWAKLSEAYTALADAASDGDTDGVQRATTKWNEAAAILKTQCPPELETAPRS